jgi:hypothetical protein
MHNSVCHVYDVFLLSNLSQSSMGCQASIVAILLSERSKVCVANLCSDAYSATLLCFAGAQLPGRAHSNVEGQQMVASWMDAWWLATRHQTFVVLQYSFGVRIPEELFIACF